MSTSLRQFNNEKDQIRRRATSKGLSFGPLATAITVGTVALLLGVTFIGDWLRTPKVAAEASPSIISPNGDQAQDSANFSYTLEEDATVTVDVFNQAGQRINTIMTDQFQTRGQHVVVWNGLNDLGQVVSDGRYRIQVTAAGTVRSGTQSAPVEVDTQPPNLRLANLDEINRVKEANLALEGITDPGAVVKLQGDPNFIPVNSDGHFSIKRQLVEGTNTIELLATDPAGNIATVSHDINLITRPPEIAVTSPPNDLWTNESIIAVSGVVPPGTTLRVNSQEAALNDAGEFDREVVLQEGDNIIRIEAIDDVGNVASQELVLHRKSAAPTLGLNVADGETFQQSEIQISGKTDTGATVLIGGQAVTVSPLGEFQTTVNLLNGENILDVQAIDQAGNVTQRQYRLNYEITAPESELARVARNLPSLSRYFVPVALALPILLTLAYLLTRPVALVVSSENSSFQPGLPAEGRFLRLFIDLSKAARTTVNIKDKRGNVVSTLLHRRHRTAGQHPLYWDGYDDFGRVVPPGNYTIEATAGGPGGSVTGNLNITVVEDPAVHRQYIRRTPYQEETERLYRQRRQSTRTGGSPARRR